MKRRMITPEITSSGRFLRMSMTAQALYMHFVANADDDGIVDAYSVMRLVGAKEDDVVLLREREFITVLDEQEYILWVTGWQDFNWIDPRLKEDSLYLPLLRAKVEGLRIVESRKEEANRGRYARLKIERQAKRNDPQGIPGGSSVDTPEDPAHRIGKDRKGEDSSSPLAPQGENGKEMAISPEVREVWDAWTANVAPITVHKVFQRNALSRLLKAHGNETLTKMIRVVGAAHADRYAPKEAKPFNPKQLEERWDAVFAWGRSKAAQQNATAYVPGKKQP